jgi:ubiquinone/menaquinone biosynthesis C-methylase UbiE
VNLHSTNELSDLPGSTSKNSFERYGHLYDLIASHLNKEYKIIDIGCATGGCLKYLTLKGFSNLFGVDPSEEYIKSAKQKSGHNFSIGSAECIPFNDNLFDVAILDQVLEHLVDPRKALREAGRVMKKGGLLCIGVPDAARYSQVNSLDFIWFQIREHIQHFDLEHLKLIAAADGFEFVASSNSISPMTSNKMMLPNLIAIFRYTGRTVFPVPEMSGGSLKNKIISYIECSKRKLKEKRKILKELSKLRTPIFAWGIAREFLYLYSSAGLKHCNIAGLIDSNVYKQDNFTVDGHEISGQAVLGAATPDSVLIITAIAHTDQIENSLKDLRYPGTVLGKLFSFGGN